MTTVIIPAHNEAVGIERCLRALRPNDAPEELQVIVVCNGCSDTTAAVAASFAGVEVIETAVANKTTALNLGDEAARSSPRMYLDADIELPRDVVDLLVAQLQATGSPAATVRFRLDLSEASRSVARHYRARSRAPYPDHLVGRGVYCLSEAGRSRFGEFPPVIGDDLFVQSLFSPDEVTVVDAFSAVVKPPETIRELVRVQSRVAAGNREHRQLYPESGQQGSAAALVRANLQPRRWLDLATFLGVVGASRFVARLRAARGAAKWETSRTEASGESHQGSEATMLTSHLGMPISVITWPELEEWAAVTAAGGDGATVCTVAPYQAYLWRTNASYATALARASVVLVDGNGVRLALTIAGVHSGGRLTGREVVQRIFDGSLLPGLRVAVIGSSPASQQAVADRRPDWLLLGGSYPPEPEPALVRETVASLDDGAIDVVLVALGCPKQELWADAFARRHPGVYFCIGGAVDTVVGTKVPPPHAVERFGMEWAWRLAQDPALARHLARAALVMPTLLARALRERLAGQ
jgi:exopolysaccharide biosynthesis WecB/TagA/CpsF family protein